MEESPRLGGGGMQLLKSLRNMPGTLFTLRILPLTRQEDDRGPNEARWQGLPKLSRAYGRGHLTLSFLCAVHHV